MANKELDELLEKIDDIRRTESLTSDDLDLIVRLLKGETDRKSDRQTGPAKGQRYWIHRLMTVAPYVYEGDDFDLNAGKYRDMYPEKRFAEAERRARKLIMDVNKRRRELNEGKELGGYQCYIVFWNVFREAYELDARVASDPLYDRGLAYPFGLFKNSVDCETCMREFEDELEWFYEEYLPLMAELDGYDWADAPGWGGEV